MIVEIEIIGHAGREPVKGRFVPGHLHSDKILRDRYDPGPIRSPPTEIASCAKAGALEESTTKAAWFGLQIAPLQRSLSDTLSPILSFSEPTQIQRPLRFVKISTERKGLLKAFPPMAPFTRLTDCAIAVEPTIRTM